MTHAGKAGLPSCSRTTALRPRPSGRGPGGSALLPRPGHHLRDLAGVHMIRTLTPIRSTVEHDALAEFCNDMLRHLARSDQRQWGEIYVRGLVSMPGRKSIRRMSDCIVGGRADQGIQQFVNQSPWDWVPVRRNLAAYAATLFRPQAWVVEEAV